MAEWLIDEGIGEHRAALIEDGRIIEAAIDRLDTRARVGAVLAAKLGERVGRGAWLSSEAGDLILDTVPAGLSQGSSLLVEIVRESIPEPGRLKPPRARASDAASERPAPTLAERLGVGSPCRPPLDGPDPLEAAGWSELIEEAATGEIDFAGGHLRLSPTPAMTLFDIDGNMPTLDLALAGTRAAAMAIRRLAIGGSIGIDIPTLGSKAERTAVADAIDVILPQPYERTAVNGFGFVQIVRPRPRPSIPELVRADAILTASLALLKIAARHVGSCRLVACPSVISLIDGRADWRDMLSRRIGGAVSLRPEPGCPISGGYVEPFQN